MSETDIVHDIIDALNGLPSTRVFRNNTGKRGGVRYGLAVGSSDIIGWAWGRFFAIEVKKPGERPTEKQQEFLNSVRFDGGYSCCVTSVQEALEHWKHACAKRGAR